MGKYGTTSLEDLESSLAVTSDFALHYEKSCRASAWLFTHTTDAIAAIEWARKRNISIPRELSVISFENNAAAFDASITACVPDWETIGYLLANSITGALPVARTSQGYIHTKALVFERCTTP
jgi:DNA-binding LacI/PurR family transcriptional regulator